MSETQIGTVKWFNTSKGFGFILMEDGTEIFVHYQDIQTEGFRNLAEGQKVSFTVQNTGKGLRAADVKPL